MNKKFFSIFFLTSIVVTNCIRGMEKIHSTVFDGVAVYHQFEYKNISDKDKERLTAVFERGDIVIDSSKGESALVFPASPCVAVAAKIPRAVTQAKKGEDRTFVAHVHYSNRIADIPKKIETALKIGSNYSSSDLVVSLFSKEMNHDRFNREYDHGGRSQEEHMKFIKDTITSYFGIKEQPVQSYLFDAKQHNQEIENCGFIHKTVFIDGSERNGSIQLYSTSPQHEGIFKNYNGVRQPCVAFLQQAYGRLWMSPYIWGNIWRYNKVPFAEVPKYNVASLNEMVSNINPYDAIDDATTPLNCAIIIGQSACIGLAASAVIVGTAKCVAKVHGNYVQSII
jgi:hypothetical protein